MDMSTAFYTNFCGNQTVFCRFPAKGRHLPKTAGSKTGKIRFSCIFLSNIELDQTQKGRSWDANLERTSDKRKSNPQKGLFAFIMEGKERYKEITFHFYICGVSLQRVFSSLYEEPFAAGVGRL